MPTYRNTQGPYDAVLCDIDGCLLDEAGGPLNLNGLAAVAEHNARAKADRDRPLVTVCTGRPLPFAECICRAIANDVLPCVCENGAWVYDPATNGYHLNPDISDAHVEATHAFCRWCLDTYGRDGVSSQPGKHASVSLYHADPEFLETIKPALVQACAENHWPFRISGTWNYINCDLQHIQQGHRHRAVSATHRPRSAASRRHRRHPRRHRHRREPLRGSACRRIGIRLSTGTPRTSQNTIRSKPSSKC